MWLQQLLLLCLVNDGAITLPKYIRISSSDSSVVLNIAKLYISTASYTRANGTYIPSRGRFTQKTNAIHGIGY